MSSRQLITAIATFAISASAFAYRAPSGTAYRSQPRVLDSRQVNRSDRHSDRSLKAAIKAKRKEVKQLRKAGDPRAAQAEQELRFLRDQRKQNHGQARNNHQFDDRGNRQFGDGDRDGDRVHGKQHRDHKDDDGDRVKARHDRHDDDDDDDQDDDDHHR